MKPNDLLFSPDGKDLLRVLQLQNDRVLVIDCSGKSMPNWGLTVRLETYTKADESAVYDRWKLTPVLLDDLTPKQRKKALERYTIISGVLAVLSSKQDRDKMITVVSDRYQISKQTIRAYLKKYLILQNIAMLAPAERTRETVLTSDQKNIRRALNKYYYTQHQNSLPTAYTMMLKERYTDADGKLLPEHPTYNQFRYFFRKTNKAEKQLISRDGIKAYQRNSRPLLGDCVQSYAPAIGTAFLDGTICDIYLVDDAGQLIGRPALVAAIDVNTSLCLGYTLLWGSGVYSLQRLMMNIVADKVALCERNGIPITPEQWPNKGCLPGVMVTDRGCEYTGASFEQITGLGVTLINLPAYRPELKGLVEKFFDLVQQSYKDALKGKGVIMPDFQDRGAHDYRKDAVLTIELFERIVLKAIVFYNSHRVIENYPYTPQMLDAEVPPYANTIWAYKQNEPGANLIPVTENDIVLTLLPRTTGVFSRKGLSVNRLRYYAEGYKEAYLNGGKATVAYDPENCDVVWLVEDDGRFVPFQLIESRFAGMSLPEVEELLRRQKNLTKTAAEENYAARVELLSFIESVAGTKSAEKAQTKGGKYR